MTIGLGAGRCFLPPSASPTRLLFKLDGHFTLAGFICNRNKINRSALNKTMATIAKF
ncbi:MAG: hypothetical protein ACREDM_06645 [Methylocella sp.]